MKNIDLVELEDNIKNWAYKNISEKFEFREHQFETIFNICKNILEDVNHTQIIEAPTGSGKSLMNIISAGVLADYYGKSSYILCSDLYLWKQYEDFIVKHPFIKQKFGILKGQTGNYNCYRNNEDMRNADCRIAGISWAKLFNYKNAKQLGYECVLSCPYVKARKKALMSKVVVMTYQLYHYMINVVDKHTDSENQSVFRSRDILFCDECHNIPNIVTNNFTPTIKKSDIAYLKTLHTYHGHIQLDLFDEEPTENENNKYNLIYKSISLAELEDTYDDIFNRLSNKNTTPKEEDEIINEYLDLLNKFAGTVEAIESSLSHKKQILNKSFTNDDILMYKCCSWYRNCMCFWNDFKTCVDAVGMEYIIKEVSEDRNNEENVIRFTCVKEDYVTWRFLISTANHRVMLSATTGGYDAFVENIGGRFIQENFSDSDEEILYSVIPSTFDFSKSPIYFLNRYKMSFREKEKSLASLKPIIYKLCEKFADKRGMIQTGSYSNAKALYDAAPSEIRRRMLLYNNSKEKTKMITIHQMSNDTILVGPTLVEGIDLPGDQCRFIVILKVPYPVIVDDFVKRKIELFPLWYNSVTSNTIIQGVGRGNRFSDDYCVTYILDACFLSLYNATKDQYPKEMQDRIKIYI